MAELEYALPNLKPRQGFDEICDEDVPMSLGNGSLPSVTSDQGLNGNGPSVTYSCDETVTIRMPDE